MEKRRVEYLKQKQKNGRDISKEYKNFNDWVFNKAVFEKLPDQSR